MIVIRNGFDVIGYLDLLLLIYAFVEMVIGWTIVIRFTLRSPDRKRLFKNMLTKSDGFNGQDPRGLKHIYRGALCGAIVFATFGTLVLFL